MYTRGFFVVVIHAYLAAYVRRRRRVAAARAVGWAVAGVVASALLACVADRLRPLPSAVRAAWLGVSVAAAVAVTIRPVLRLCRRRFEPVAAAAAVERQHPAFAHRLVTAASPSGGSADLRAAVDRDAADLVPRIGPAFVPRRPLATAWAAAAVALVTAAGLWRSSWLDLPDLSRRLLRPTAGPPAVTSTRLAVLPGDAAVLEDRPLTITAVATPAGGEATLHVSDDAGRTWAARPMPPAGQRFRATVPDLDRALTYFVTAGDAVSPTYAVRVRRVPAVVAFRVRLDYPADVRRPPLTTTDPAGRIDAPAGTGVTVDVVATVPLRSAVLTVGPDRLDTTSTADPTVRRGHFTVDRDAPLSVQLTAADGTPGIGPASARVRLRSPSAVDPDVPGFADQQQAYRAATDRR